MSKQQSYYELNCYRFHQGVMRKAEPGEEWDVDLLQEVALPQWREVLGKWRLEGRVGGSEESASSQTTHIQSPEVRPPRSSCWRSWVFAPPQLASGEGPEVRRKRETRSIGDTEQPAALQHPREVGHCLTNDPPKVMAVPALPLSNSSFGQI